MTPTVTFIPELSIRAGSVSRTTGDKRLSVERAHGMSDVLGSATVTGTPGQSAVIGRAKELLHYARSHGYKPDELIQIIQQLR